MVLVRAGAWVLTYLVWFFVALTSPGLSEEVFIVIGLVAAGVYLATRPSGPAVELALKASDLGPDWEGDKLMTCHEGRGITQEFFRIVSISLGIIPYQWQIY